MTEYQTGLSGEELVRLLLVEDSPRLQHSLVVGMRKAGNAVDVEREGAEGLRRAMDHEYDVMILELMLPGMDGLSVLKALRTAGRQTHVLILTARDHSGGPRAGAADGSGRLFGEAFFI